jgi:hypothetical protein
MASPGRGEQLRYGGGVLGTREAVVVDVRPWDVHGVAYVDVTVAFRDQTTETARLGSESVPAGLARGDIVSVSIAVNMIVAIDRATGS